MTNTILLAENSAEDEFFFRRVMREVGMGNPLQVVRDGQQVVNYLTREGEFADREKYPLPGVLFLDSRMSCLNGGEVLKWLKTQPHLKKMLIVVITALSKSTRLDELYALGANTFIAKPFSAEDFVNLTKSFAGYFTLKSM